MLYIVYKFNDRDFRNCFYFRTKDEAKTHADSLGDGWFWMELKMDEVGK